MKKLSVVLLIILLFTLVGCASPSNSCNIVATTLPVYDFTASICKGTPLTVGRLVTEDVSCLHDYTLQVSQMRMLESADIVIISGAGLEEFLHDVLSTSKNLIDCSGGVHIHNGSHDHQDTHEDEHDHHHDMDPHIWLSAENAAIMADNICEGLSNAYPQYAENFHQNLKHLHIQLDDLQSYGDLQLSDLRYRDLITFHDGFAYFAESFSLNILESVEEESGSEASASEIIHLVELVNEHHLPAVFTEKSGSDACAGIICAETGAETYILDMAMAGESYFDAMYHNIDTVKEALG